MVDIDIGELEKKVKEVLEKNPNDAVELSDLSENSYEQLKNIFRVNYEVIGVINILRIGNMDENYIFYIKRR